MMGNSKFGLVDAYDACPLGCPGRVSETIWSHFWLLQGRDVKTLGNLLGVLGVVLIVFSPGLGPLAAVLARPSSPDSDCPRKHKHTHNAVPCHAMHLPCDCQFFGSRIHHMGANSTFVSQPTSTIFKMQCMSRPCFFYVFPSLSPLVLSCAPSAPPVLRHTRQSERRRRQRALDDVSRHLGMSPILACPQVLPCSLYQAILVNSTVPACRVMAVLWDSARPPSHTFPGRTKGHFAVHGCSPSLLRILTPSKTPIQQSRLVWRR